jgi:F0F1-type ATP synthase membrane subunit b/b'
MDTRNRRCETDEDLDSFERRRDDLKKELAHVEAELAAYQTRRRPYPKWARGRS